MLLGTEIYIIVFFLTIVLGLFVLFNNQKSLINRYFCLLSFSLGFWIFSNILVNLIQDLSIIFVRIAIIWVALLPIFFNKFIKYLYFSNNEKYKNGETIIFTISSLVSLFIIIFSQTNLNVKSISFQSWGVDYEPGMLYIVLFFYLILSFGFSFIYLYKISLNPNNQNRNQIKLILFGALITLTLSLFTNIIFPFLGYGFFNIFGPITTLIFLTFIAYSITKHHLFNIKVITVEVVIFGLWVMMLTRIFLAESRQDMLIEGGLLLITVIFGIMLIKSVLHEISQREQIEKLAKDIKVAYAEVKNINEHLEEKIDEQTKDVRRAYEVEKEARAKLELLNKTKDEFITSTQHHLRTPLTSLKWGLETIRKTTKGSDDGEIQQALNSADESVGNMTNIIENFIKITEKK